MLVFPPRFLRPQPQSVFRLNGASPLAAKLVFAVDLGVRSPDVVSGKRNPAVVVSARTFWRGKYAGFGPTFGTSDVDYVQTAFRALAPRRSYFVRIYLGGIPNSFPRLFEIPTTPGAEGLLVISGSNSLQYSRVWSRGSVSWATASGSVVVGNYYDVLVTYDASSPANAPVFYLNGKQVSSSLTTSAPSGVATESTTGPYLLGNRIQLDRAFGGLMQGFYIWDRVLAPAEVASISANPWQIFTTGKVHALATTGAPQNYTLTAAAGALVFTGKAAQLPHARALLVTTGTFSVGATTTRLQADHRLVASTGAFAVFGNATGLAETHRITMAPAAFSISGGAVAFAISRGFGTSTGVFSVAGAAAGLIAGRLLSAAPGTFAADGVAATLTKSNVLTLVAGAGPLAVAGSDAALTVQRRMSAADGAFTASGTDTGLRATRGIAASAGAFLLTGKPAALRLSRYFSTGVFSVAGNVAALRVTRQIAPEPGAIAVDGSDATLSTAAIERAIIAAPGVFTVTGGAAVLRSSHIYTPDEIWNYPLSNGLTAAQTLAEALDHARNCCG